MPVDEDVDADGILYAREMVFDHRDLFTCGGVPFSVDVN